MRALILLAHGSSDPKWQQAFWDHLAFLRSTLPGNRLELAFMESCSPTLVDVCMDLQKGGVAEAEVLPVFLAEGGHISRDVPQLVSQAQIRARITLILLKPVGAFPEFRECLFQIVRNVAY